MKKQHTSLISAPPARASDAIDALVDALVDAFITLDDERASLVEQRLAEVRNANSNGDGDWLSLRAAADYACTTPAVLRRAIREGALDAERRVDGGKWWTRRASVDRWRRAGS